MSEQVNQEALTGFVERIEELHDQRSVLNETIRAVYEHAKDAGLVPVILRQIVRERQLDGDVRNEQHALLDAYRRALGMLAATPLGEAAMHRAASQVIPMPRAFAEQPVHDPARPRGRPRKTAAETLFSA
jgi:uncharacterized protein (UPF0335 family)